MTAETKTAPPPPASAAPDAKAAAAAAAAEKVKADVAAAVALGKSNLSAGTDALLSLEKAARLAEDSSAATAAVTALLDLLKAAGAWPQLNETVLLLAKRRGQLKAVVQAFVRQASGFVDDAPGADAQAELMKTLLAVTEGRIYVEIDRARLTRRLAAAKEAAGDLDGAAELLQEVAVETFGAMAKSEKIDFILEQVRLCLDRGDYVRAQILSKKVAPRAFSPPAGKKGETAGEVGIEGTIIEAPAPGTPPLDALKLKYYDLLVRYYNHTGSAVDVARCYRAQYDTPALQAEDGGAAADEALKRVCWYAALAPASSDRTTLMAAAAAEPRMDGLPGYKSLLATFTSKEIVWWPALEEAHASEMAACADVFGGGAGSPGAVRREALRSRVIEHNIHTAAGYYGRMPTARLAALLGLTPDEAERRVADMVTGGALAAKIDRPAGVVRFGARPAADETLNAWAADVSKLLALVEKAAAGVAKEAAQYGLADLAALAG